MHCEYDKDPSVFVAEQGGSYAFELGIDLENLKSEEVYKWFLAALLYGAHISEKNSQTDMAGIEKISRHVTGAGHQCGLGPAGIIAG